MSGPELRAKGTAIRSDSDSSSDEADSGEADDDEADDDEADTDDTDADEAGTDDTDDTETDKVGKYSQKVYTRRLHKQMESLQQVNTSLRKRIKRYKRQIERLSHQTQDSDHDLVEKTQDLKMGVDKDADFLGSKTIDEEARQLSALHTSLATMTKAAEQSAQALTEWRKTAEGRRDGPESSKRRAEELLQAVQKKRPKLS